jgi:hypothetical protein
MSGVPDLHANGAQGAAHPPLNDQSPVRRILFEGSAASDNQGGNNVGATKVPQRLAGLAANYHKAVISLIRSRIHVYP